MQTAPGQLVVRQHERFRCSLPARVAVGVESAGRVVLAAGDATGAAEVAAEVIDCSGGGLGLRCGTFLPKLCIVSVRLVCHDEHGQAETVDLTARVQRAAMTDRTPTYYIGTAFLGEGAEHERRVARLMTSAKLAAVTDEKPEAPRA